jgi:acyl-CoA reductase-like NAD-dependent aldehyde dehydrogenase
MPSTSTTTDATGATKATTEATEIVSRNPATGEEIGRVPVRSAEDVALAVERARRAQKSWRELSYGERGRVVMRARALVLEDLDEIATLVSRESGKPVA